MFARQLVRRGFQVPGNYARLTARALGPIRAYSDKKVDPKSKYRTIDEFNKYKKEYSFGNLDEGETRSSPTSDSYKNYEEGEFQESEMANINQMIEQDPRLEGLVAGSKEYYEQYNKIHNEIKHAKAKFEKRQERAEKIKAVGIGLFFLVSIITAHQVILNYEYLSTMVKNRLNFREIDDSKIADMSDPAKNTKNIQYLVAKITDEINKNPDFVSNIQDSKEVAGLYLFGAINKQKLPTRFKFFDNVLIQDVKVLKDYLVVVDKDGKVYHYFPKLKEPQRISLPSKVEKTEVSGNLVYYLTKKGDVLYSPRLDSTKEFEGIQTTSWIGIKKQQRYNKINFPDYKRGEKTKDIATGEGHLLILSNQGRLFISKTNTTTKNFGQFGLPSLSPFTEPSNQTNLINRPFELRNLNYEIVSKRDGTKYLQPRVFQHIASGLTHNIVSDANNNIWSWGSNVYGECGGEISYRTDIQAVPKKILSQQDIFFTTRHLFKNRTDCEWVVENVYAGAETSFVELNYIDHEDGRKSQKCLLSFGNGIKGQLGNSRFLHVCPQPQIVKSLLNLTEFKEKLNVVGNVGFKNITVGNNHAFITLDNEGDSKDVVTFGDNEFGQFGNGKVVKSCKPVLIPKLLEPNDFVSNTTSDKKKLAKKLNDVVTSRLQLFEDQRIKGKLVDQVITAGENSGAIYYKPVCT